MLKKSQSPVLLHGTMEEISVLEEERDMVFFMTLAMAVTAVLMLFITADVAEYKS
ncbi:MAG: hypothetical protein ACI33P_13440 [Lysinibacillus sp.]